MTDDFVAFPHTPHLAWLAAGTPRADKVMSIEERCAFLDGPILVEEKVDGANLGLSFDKDGNIRAQNRGGYILPPWSGQFSKLGSWVSYRLDTLFDGLGSDLILFGEWLAVVHSIEYASLPDWFLGFDVFDRRTGKFWSVAERDRLLLHMDLVRVPSVTDGRFSLQQLVDRLSTSKSRVSDGRPEGFYLRREFGRNRAVRAKLVRADFTQSIREHWSRRQLRSNRLSSLIHH